MLEHFHEGNLTYRVAGTEQKISDAFVAVSPAFARERGLEEGDWVRLTSRSGSLKARVVLSDQVRDHELYMPVCSSVERINMLSSSHADPAVDTPAYKELAVRLEKLPERGDSPMPHTNPRNGEPTPRPGVEVERKWDRPDYVFPDHERPAGGQV